MKVDEDLQHQIMQHSNSSASASASQLLPSLNFDDDNDLGFQNLAGMGDDCDDLPDVFWDYGDVSSNDVNVRNMEYSTEGSGAHTTNIIPSPSPPSTATNATTATNTNTNTTGTIQPQPQAQPATLDKNNSNSENRTTSTTAPQAQLPPPQQQQQQLQNNIRGFQNSNVDVGGLGNSPYLNAAAAAGVGVGGVGFPQLSGNLGNLGSFPFLLPPPPGPGQALDNNVNVNGAGSLSLASSLQQAQQQAQQQQQQAQQQQQNSQLLNVLPRAPNSAGGQSVSSNTPNTAAQVLQNQLFGMSAAQGALNPLVYQSIQQQQAQAQAQQPSNNQQQQQQQAANLQFLQQQLQGQALLPPHLFIQQSTSVSGGNNNQNQNQNTGMLPPQGIQTAQHQSLRPLPPPQSKLNVNANSQSTNSQQQQQQQQTYQSQMLPLASAPQGGRNQNQNQPQQSQGQGQSSNTGITQASMSMPKPIPKRTAQHLQLTDRGKTPDTNNDKPSTITTATTSTMPSPRQQNVKANIVSSSDTDGEHQRSQSQSAATSTSTSTSIKKSRRSPPTSVEISTNSSISQKLYMPSSISSYIDLDRDIDASEQDHNGLMEVNNMLPGDGGPGQLKHAQHAHAADEQMTEAERALANRKRNREHARNTRARKKAYLESLKSTLDELCRERDSLYSERAGAASLLLEVQKTRTDVLLSFFALRSSYEKRRQLWSSILDENVNCVMPVTPYRSFPASEVQISKCQRTIMGVDSMIADAASMHVLLHSLVDRSRFPNGKVEFRYTLVAEEAVVSGNQMMARWSMSTTNAIKLGGKKEVKKMGMLCAKFNSAHKIVSLELMFDVMAFMLQLKQSVGANAFTVIPNTVQTCTGSFGKTPMVLTLADRPYTIVQVNEEWEKMTGRKAEDVVGKESCKILQGAQTESSAIGEQMASICFQRPVFTVLTNYAADGRKFRNFISLYPLSTDSKITHYLGLTLHLEWLDEKDKKKEEEKKEKAPESSSSVAATTTAAASTTAVTTKTTKIIKTEGKETGE